VSLFGRLLGRQKSRWPESWQTYPGFVGDAAALWTVDLGAIDAAPVASLPVRLDVSVPYPADVDGLPTGHLVEAEVAIRSVVDELGGVYLGRVASGGRCRFTAHLPAQPSAAVHVPGLADAVATVEDDPHWAYVRDTLAPDARQHRLLADRVVLDALASAGDRFDVPREVEHLAFFADEGTAEAAAGDLRAEGFTTAVGPDGTGELALTATRTDPVAPPRLHNLTWWVQEAIERHGGTYDGWSCAVAF